MRQSCGEMTATPSKRSRAFWFASPRTRCDWWWSRVLGVDVDVGFDLFCLILFFFSSFAFSFFFYVGAYFFFVFDFDRKVGAHLEEAYSCIIFFDSFFLIFFLFPASQRAAREKEPVGRKLICELIDRWEFVAGRKTRDTGWIFPWYCCQFCIAMTMGQLE